MSTPYDHLEAFDLNFPFKPLDDLIEEFPGAKITMKYHMVPSDTRKFVRVYVVKIYVWEQHFGLSVFEPWGDNVIEYARNLLNKLFPITD